MSILDLLFPEMCLGCKKTGQYFCDTCREKIIRVSQVCPVCEKPSPFGQTHPVCSSRYSLDGLCSFFSFDGLIKKAIHELKYRFVTSLKDELLSLVFKDISWKGDFLVMNKFIIQYKPIIVSIPLYWHKYNYRGFNQSTLIGQFFADKYKLLFSEEILLRKRATISQTKLSMEERRKNVEDVFFINIEKEKMPENILLVDDVWTTGATLKTAGNLLKRNGAKRVWGVTIAR